MSNAQRRLSLLRRDLHELAERYRQGGWVACNGEDIADDVKKVLIRDQDRIGKSI